MKKHILIVVACSIVAFTFACNQQHQISKTKTESQGGGNGGTDTSEAAREGMPQDYQALVDSSIADSLKAVDRGIPVSEEGYRKLKEQAEKAEKKPDNPNKKGDDGDEDDSN